MKLPVAFDETVAREFAPMIDRCEFRTVKRYVRSPTSEISLVVVVAPGYALEEVAATFATPYAQHDSRVIETLLTTGVMTFGVDDVWQVKPGYEAHVVRLDRIADTAVCRVIYLPPCYVVQLVSGALSPGCAREE